MRLERTGDTTNAQAIGAPCSFLRTISDAWLTHRMVLLRLTPTGRPNSLSSCSAIRHEGCSAERKANRSAVGVTDARRRRPHPGRERSGGGGPGFSECPTSRAGPTGDGRSGSGADLSSERTRRRIKRGPDSPGHRGHNTDNRTAPTQRLRGDAELEWVTPEVVVSQDHPQPLHQVEPGRNTETTGRSVIAGIGHDMRRIPLACIRRDGGIRSDRLQYGVPCLLTVAPCHRWSASLQMRPPPHPYGYAGRSRLRVSRGLRRSSPHPQPGPEFP